MNIKMIVTDLDGTLLRKNKTISEYSASVFRRCKENGIKTVYATARPIRAVEKWLNLPVSFDASVYHNGAVIDLYGEKTLRYGISQKEVKEILSLAIGKKICIEINDSLYGNFDPSDIWQGIEIILTDFTDLPESSADKIILPMASLEELQNVASILPDNLYIEMSENTVGMIMNKKATKAEAIKHLVNHYGLSLSDVAAFGDDYNDIEMLRECGVGVAVANALDEVKAAADYICDTNDNDGIAKWIEENIL